MQSLSKTPVSIEIARQIAEKHLGATLVEFRELTDGFFNTACCLGLENGSRCVLKVAPPAEVNILRYERNILSSEVAVLKLVRAQTSIPVPEIICHDESRSLLPSPFFIMDFVEGVPLHKQRESLTQNEQSEIDRQIGAYLREMNAIPGAEFGYFAQPDERRNTWPEAFARIFANVLEDGRMAGVELPYDELACIPGQYTEALAEVRSPRLVHWDLWDGNIFIDPVSHQITGIIDFERALWADPLMECNFGAFGINPNFIAGYGLELPYSPRQALRRSLYNTYLYLIMVIECTYRQYPGNDQEKWARAQLQRELKNLPTGLKA